MKKSKKVLAICMASVMTAQMGMIASNADVKTESLLDKATRISGSDKYETANKISQKFDLAETVIIASGVNFPDALCATPLAKKTNSPIFLSKKDKLISNTMKEIKRLKSKKAIIVGGENSISKNVEKQLTDSGLSVTRISGADRYETSVEIAKHLPKSNEVAVASGAGFADALSISEVAAQRQIPILLSSKDKLPTKVDKFIKDVGANKTYVVGGESALSKNIINQVPGAKRLAGTDRYKTNAVVNNQFKSIVDFKNVYVASGKTFPDALSGSPLAAKQGGPLVLVGNGLDSNVKTLLEENMKTDSKVTIFGGENSVSNKVSNDVVECIPPNNGGGGGGGHVEKPNTIKDAIALKTAIEDTSITNIDLDDNYTDTTAVEATRLGGGDLTINFKSEQDIGLLTINAPELQNLTLNDDGLGEFGAKINTLIINTPKAHVINNVQTNNLVIKSVSTSTLVVKDKVTQAVNMEGKGTLDVHGVDNVNVVNIGSKASDAKIIGDSIKEVSASASVEINVPVQNVVVAPYVVGAKLSGSGNLQNVKNYSPTVIDSTGIVARLDPRANVILDSKVTNIAVSNNISSTINISGKGKVDGIVAKGEINLNMDKKVDIIEAEVPVKLVSPVGVLIPKTNRTIDINSEIEEVLINAEGSGVKIEGNGLIKKAIVKAPVILGVPAREVEVPIDSMGASIEGMNNIGTLTVKADLMLNAGKVQQIKVPTDSGDVNILGGSSVRKVIVESSVEAPSKKIVGLSGIGVENVVIPAGARNVEIQGHANINNINTMESVRVMNPGVSKITAENSVEIYTNSPLPLMFKVCKLYDVQNPVLLWNNGVMSDVNITVAKEPVIKLSLDEADKGISPNPNQDNFKAVTFELEQQEVGTKYYYTLDGTTPTESSAEYTGKVTLDAGTDFGIYNLPIKVVGVKETHQNSSVAYKDVVFAQYQKINPTYTNMVIGNVNVGEVLNNVSVDATFNVGGTIRWDQGNNIVRTNGSYMWNFAPNYNPAKEYNSIMGYEELEVN